VLKDSGRSFGWDYAKTDITVNGVVRFELKLDAGAYISVGIPTIQNDAQTTVGTDTYTTPISNTLTPGNHTAVVRACTLTVCSADSAPLPFVFAVLPAPANTRVK
jgi:hypothetical protein